ncbi:MAG: hypothetical protein J0L53_01970 [Spirochaetes bacterium]|nr:hypothetical protein [Spirochaetota bacterium]MBX3721137.1 hypothetical protein [Turneriella sp.]
MGKGKFVALSTLFGLLGFALAAAAAGFIFDKLGDQHPHGPGSVLVAIIAAIYLAPVGAVTALIASLVMKERSFKKLSLVLVLAFAAVIAALVVYVKVLVART